MGTYVGGIFSACKLICGFTLLSIYLSDSKVDEDGDINMDEEPKELILGKDLEQQISDAIDSFFLKQLVCGIPHS